MSGNPVKKKKRNPFYYLWLAVKAVLLTVFRLVAAVMMVGAITGCIVASVMTVYILQYVGAEEEIDLQQIRLGYTSVLYYFDENGEEQELQRLYNRDGNRTWVSYEEINENTKKAMVAIEDKRFWAHQGVDWRRTLGAFANLFSPGASTGGGSTIHQQLIKNLTGDDDYRIDRKVREIFRALHLAQTATHEQVLEAYLNVVPFGQNSNGIQAAAKTYFDKDAKDLTLAESAAIVGITQKPTAHNPFLYPERNKERQLYVLWEMLQQGLITQQEHDRAERERLDFKKTEYFESISNATSWFTDHVIESVIDDLAELRGWTRPYAEERLFRDGYKIYTTVDMRIQNLIEDYYLTWDNFPQQVRNEIHPQSAFVVLEPNGKIVGLVGGIGEKTWARGWCRATRAKRQPGSSIKPISMYAIAMEYDRITWSTMIEDSPFEENWPLNFDRVYRGPITVDHAIKMSVNTVAVKLTDMLTPRVVFDHLKNNLRMDSIVERRVQNNQIFSDIALAPMSLGAVTDGITPLEMIGAYQMFANGGNFTKPYSYYRVLDSNGRVVLEPNTIPNIVLSYDTSVVMNKLLQSASLPGGTGSPAQIGSQPVAGKTGTSSDDVDQWYIGMTPYYVGGVWLGYDEKTRENNMGTIRYNLYPPPLIFKDLMTQIHEGLERMEFTDPESAGVVSRTYCTFSGGIASARCESVASGWYKRGHEPGTCHGIHYVPPENNDDDDDADDRADRPRPLRQPDNNAPDDGPL
ncbi:MAG: transglycosylase domain-containing protein [Oscillospiraceae bacterium]|nr:transglycosylase domain-containing protein [Oscillospiraceae bacterium]